MLICKRVSKSSSAAYPQVINIQKNNNWPVFIFMSASALCLTFTIIPPLLTDPQQFHYCIDDSNPGTGADDALVLKRGVWCNATWPSHSRPAIAASARHFQICFLPEYFDRLFVYLLFIYLVLFMH